MVFPNKKVFNFLSPEEIISIDNFFIDYPQDLIYRDIDSRTGKHVCDCYPILLEDPRFKILTDILLAKIQQHFDKDLIVESCHLLESYNPYGIHSDVQSGSYDPVGNIIPAWTFIIPLANFDSNTIVFHQTSPYVKTVGEWIEQNACKPLDVIDDQFCEKYLDHCWRPHIRYLTVEEIFPWSKGTLFASDRSKFHTSDNYHQQGLTKKRALIFWTGYQRLSQ